MTRKQLLAVVLSSILVVAVVFYAIAFP